MPSVTEYITQGRSFLNEVTTELRKVYWPPRRETLAFTGVVTIVVVFIAVYLGLCDYFISLLLSLVF
jgi:preprotein translocase subunit SecE